MSIINNSHAIGVDTRNLVLKTRGTLHVKVGDRYYEIDFRNLNKPDEESEKEKEEFIISVDNKDSINSLEYPGDNKLIVGLDGSWFVTKDNAYVDITPKIPETTTDNQIIDEKQQINSLETVFINGSLYGPGNLRVDFVNEEITVDTLTVNQSISYPDNTVKNKCCKSNIEIHDYRGMDFIDLVTENDRLLLKSGVLVKSHITKEISVGINTIYSTVPFESGGLYILYVSNEELTYTRLN